MSRVSGNFHVTGRITAGSMTVPASAVVDSSVASNAAVQRVKLAQELASEAIPMTALRVHDAVATPLTGTPGTDDLGLKAGTFGTGVWYVSAGDLKAAGATTRYARFTVALPAEYQAGETVQLRFSAGMLTTVSDGTATLDVEAYLNGGDTLVDGSDLCQTAAQSINSLTFANKDFVIDGTNLEAGDDLDVRIAIAVNDGSTVTVVEAAISRIVRMADIKG